MRLRRMNAPAGGTGGAASSEITGCSLTSRTTLLLTSQVGQIKNRSDPDARSLLTFLSTPLDPASRFGPLPETAEVARRARRHFLGHELKSQRVLAEVLS